MFFVHVVILGSFGQNWTFSKLLTTVQIQNGKLTTKMSFLALYKLKLVEQFMHIHEYSSKRKSQDLTSFEKKNKKILIRFISDRFGSKSI